jgi:hypothetical protein
VWCEGDAATGGCRGFNADDFAITYWVRQNVIDPYLAANPQPTATAAPTTIPMATATTTATPPAAAASPTAVPATAVPTPSPAPGPLATVVCARAQYTGGVLTCVPQE